MNPITTAIATQLNQYHSFGSIINNLQTTLGISHTVFILIIFLFILPMITITIIRTTGSALLGMILTLGVMITLTFMGILPIWISVLVGGFIGIFLFYRIFFIGEFSETLAENEKILCRFIIKNTITEEWMDINTSVITKDGYKFSIDKRFCKNEERNGKTYKVLTFRVREEDMTNQLIQDPNKVGIKPMKAEETTKYPQEYVPIMKQTPLTMLDFNSISFPRGTKTLSKLNTTHSQILDIFKGQIDNSLINTDKMKSLELDIYNQGIKVLKQVFEIASQLQKSKVDELNTTHDELTKQLEELDKTSPMWSLTNDRLEINNKSLGMIKKYNDKIDELLCQVDLYNESISEMCLELPDLLNHTSKDDMSLKLVEINNRMEIAQKVKNEYDKEGV